MKRLVCVAGFLAAVALMLGSVVAADLTVKEVMTKAHRGGNCLLASLGKELNADEPAWADVQKEARELVEVSSHLGKNDPPRGEKASWEKLTKEYVTNAKALEAAAEERDRETALASHKMLKSSCTACHKAHKPA